MQVVLDGRKANAVQIAYGYAVSITSGFPNISQLQKGIFTSLTESSAHMLSYTQGNIYISDAMGGEDAADRNQKLNSYFLSTVSSRYDNFEKVKNNEFFCGSGPLAPAG